MHLEEVIVIILLLLADALYSIRATMDVNVPPVPKGGNGLLCVPIVELVEGDKVLDAGPEEFNGLEIGRIGRRPKDTVALTIEKFFNGTLEEGWLVFLEPFDKGKIKLVGGQKAEEV
uniref:Uncharacterized protein n=1 Tax=Odontella aurita TaxID=265563 RepID=A0A7S4IBV7_9STRA|mmetsp:Transcript_22636/g.66991  ORF Transcript_22636/g.66991 Transcript_22636/m.66991 type:complete len:117 (+) Transcript_22636:389-739(+)